MLPNATQNIRTEQVQDPGKGSAATGARKAPRRLTLGERRQMARERLTALHLKWKEKNQQS